MGMVINLSDCKLYDLFNECGRHYSYGACQYFNEEYDGDEWDPIMGFTEYGDNDSSLDLEDFINDYGDYYTEEDYRIDNYIEDDEELEDFIDDYAETLAKHVEMYTCVVYLRNGNILISE